MLASALNEDLLNYYSLSCIFTFSDDIKQTTCVYMDWVDILFYSTIQSMQFKRASHL